ncbi:MAG: peptidoglycan-binding protein [Gemmatimonadaceae bacterium]|nr:peptidoglycan-binding protein [Gemmatimonadaceae bacterium]
MLKLSGNVGRSAPLKAPNAIGDVTIAQHLLRAAQHPKTKAPFFAGKASGVCDEATAKAIREFQLAHGLAAEPMKPGKAMAPARISGSPVAVAGAPTNPSETLGVIAAGTTTFRKLVQESTKVAPRLARLRTLLKSRHAYLEGSLNEWQLARKEITEASLDDDFRNSVLAQVDAVFSAHGIVLRGWNPAVSYLRSFADQHKALLNKSSKAHPGEGLHNYGVAIDVGYLGLVLVHDDGKESIVTKEHQFDTITTVHGYALQNALFKVRNDLWESPPQGSGSLFRIRLGGKDNDPNHFQAYSQFPDLYPNAPKVSMSRSLADHLSAVASSPTETVTWKPLAGHHYACDLGLGIEPIDVGTADEIWQGLAKLKKSQLVHALNVAAKKAGTPEIKEAGLTDASFRKLFDSLRGAFVAAEARYDEWVPKQEDGTEITT